MRWTTLVLLSLVGSSLAAQDSICVTTPFQPGAVSASQQPVVGYDAELRQGTTTIAAVVLPASARTVRQCRARPAAGTWTTLVQRLRARGADSVSAWVTSNSLTDTNPLPPALTAPSPPVLGTSTLQLVTAGRDTTPVPPADTTPPPPSAARPNEPAGAIRMGSTRLDFGRLQATGSAQAETESQPFWYVSGKANTATVTDVERGQVGSVRFTDATTDCSIGGGNTTAQFQSLRVYAAPATARRVYIAFGFKITGTNPRVYVNGLKFWNYFGTGNNPPTSILELFPSNFATGAGPWNIGWVFQVSGIQSTESMGHTAAIVQAGRWYDLEVVIDRGTKAHTLYIDGVQRSQVTNPLSMNTLASFEWGWVYGGGPCQGSGQNWSMLHDAMYLSYTTN